MWQAERCLYCHIHPIYDSDKCVLCGRCADICPEHCIKFAPMDSVEVVDGPRDVRAPGTLTAFMYDEEKGIRCGLCATRCPTNAITMHRFQFAEAANG